MNPIRSAARSRSPIPFTLSLLCSLGLAACGEDETPEDANLGVDGADTSDTSTSATNTPVVAPPENSPGNNAPPAASPPRTPPAASPPTPPGASPDRPIPSTPASTPPIPSPAATEMPSGPATGTASVGGAGGMGDQGGMGGTPEDPGEGGMPSDPGGAGGAAGASAGGDGGSAGDNTMGGDFDPCPDDAPCAILPLGDSITEGIGSSNNSAYRGELFRLAITDGKDITYVGTRQAGPMDIDGTPFPRAHEGTSGITVSGLDMKLGGLVDQIGDAHIILVHLGTNDMYTQPGPAMAPQRLGVFLDNVMGYWPDALIVVAQITPYPSQDGDVMTYNAAIVPIVQERIDAGAHMMMVDQHSTFPDNALADVVHPNDEGYAHMADVWYEAIGPYLKP